MTVDEKQEDRPLPAQPWLEGPPSLRSLRLSGAALAGLAVLYAALVVQQEGWVGGPLATLGGVALAVVFLAPARAGSFVALAAVAGFFALLGTGDGFDDGLAAMDIVEAIVLLGALLAAAHIQQSISRRDSELAVAADALTELTREDRITEHLSGHHHLTWLENELARARRHHHQLSLVLVRPDGFEEFDAAGHEVAESALEAVAEVIGAELRAIDIALRQDRATFSLVLPETAPEGARIAAERIRLLLPARTRSASPRALTVSTGIAGFPRDATSDRELVLVAERSLEAAVARGGNRTVVASVDTEAPAGWTLGGPGPEKAP